MTTTTAKYEIKKTTDEDGEVSFEVIDQDGDVVADTFETKADAREWVKEQEEEDREAAIEEAREAIIDEIDLSELSLETLKKIKALIARA